MNFVSFSVRIPLVRWSCKLHVCNEGVLKCRTLLHTELLALSEHDYMHTINTRWLHVQAKAVHREKYVIAGLHVQ